VPRKKRPHVATLEEIRITRDGAYAIIAYEDDSIATTQYHIGADRLARMSDEDILMLWNAGLATKEDDVRSRRDMGSALTRANVLSCQVRESPADPDHPFLLTDGRTFTAMELAKLLGAHVGWSIRIELVPPAPDSGSSLKD
jgi:hypothetical protein